MALERVQKILAQAGLGSRRACEKLIDEGRVSVNGKTISLGAKADPRIDEIRVDGNQVGKPEKKVYIAVNKPRNMLSLNVSDDDRPSIFDLVKDERHLFPVGRLDFESEGLVLLTNDGEMANQLSHPRYEHDKEYEVRVTRKPDDEQLTIWRRGVVLEDGYRTLPAQVEVKSFTKNGAWLIIMLREGKNRQIRRTGLRIGLPVRQIRRVRIGPIWLGKLQPGHFRYLRPDEINALKEYVS
ncbi:MAG: rRNA pseudouridine synthase [Chloroflexi bacterium]|jgi:23S rRNA pseudouridine2605 synthase|nr:rRNA pseudouridine synthase [Chloroflexota bacterium]